MQLHIQYTIKRLKSKTNETKLVLTFFNPIDGHTTKLYPDYDLDLHFKAEVLRSLGHWKHFNFIITERR